MLTILLVQRLFATYLIKSLFEATTYLRARLGMDIFKWRWGDLHLIEFKHVLSSNEVIQSNFDLPSVPRGGDRDTINATYGEDFIQQFGASYRHILDLSNWDNSVATNVPGQSGQPTSPHYADLLSSWADGRYLPLLFSREKVNKNVKNRLLLAPKS